MRFIRQEGQVLLTVIVAMLLMGVLGAGIYSLTTTSTLTELSSNNNDQAYHLAKAGIRYAVEKYHAKDLPETTFLMPDANHVFKISISGGVMTSTGIVNPGSFLEARRVLVYSVPYGLPLPGKDINTNDEPPSFSNPVKGPVNSTDGTGPVTVTIDPGTGAAIINLGGGSTYASGALWYQGSSTVGNCNAGACYLNLGIRVYLDFIITAEDNSADSWKSADGFLFAVISALNNTRDRTGGSAGYTGEFAGYAGPGNTASAALGGDSLGLKPPKIGVEFDTFPNDTGLYRGIYGGSDNICDWDSRNDYIPGCPGPSPGGCTAANANNSPGCTGTTCSSAVNTTQSSFCKPDASGPCNMMNFRNHIAIVFWGDRAPAGGNCTEKSVQYPRASYDDNRHGAGNPANGDPYNSSVSVESTGYYMGPKDAANTTCLTLTSPTSVCNWMEDKHKYGFRIEMVRLNGTGGSGLYQINGWIYRLDLAGVPTGAQLTHFQDVTTDTFRNDGFAPQISRTVTLTAADHAAFAQIYFGLTEGTGGSTQQIQVTNLHAYFPTTAPDSCVFWLNPANASVGTGGVTGSTFTVAMNRPDCSSWAASTTYGWITITSGSGTGSGKVTYNVAANTGAPRTGTITVGSSIFTVTQGGCTYAINPISASPSAAGGSGYSVAVTTAAGCTWAATSNDAWITVTSGGSGTGNGTVTYSVAANTGPARTGTMTIAGSIFTINQASGCSYSINPASASPGAGGGAGTVNVTTAAGCTWTAASNNAWITVTSGSSGTGNGAVGYSVAANTGPARTGTITIAGQTFTVNQASGCVYSINPTSASPGAAGGSGYTVSVTAVAGCPWTAASNNAWITVTSGGSGTGSGTVVYSVAANTGPARTGTMTIAGNTFTVTQANGCSYSINPTSASPITGGLMKRAKKSTGKTASGPFTASSNITCCDEISNIFVEDAASAISIIQVDFQYDPDRRKSDYRTGDCR